MKTGSNDGNRALTEKSPWSCRTDFSPNHSFESGSFYFLNGGVRIRLIVYEKLIVFMVFLHGMKQKRKKPQLFAFFRKFYMVLLQAL